MTLTIKYYAWLSSIEDDVRVRDLTEDEIAGLVAATRPAPDKTVSVETLAAVVEALERIVEQSRVGKAGTTPLKSKWVHYPAILYHEACAALQSLNSCQRVTLRGQP